MKSMRIILMILLVYFPSMAAWADSGLGGVAANVMSPVTVMSSFIGSASVLVGASFIFASLVKYIEHRRSPLMVPISTVVFLLIAGIVLLLLPLAYIITNNGIPYHLFN